MRLATDFAAAGLLLRLVGSDRRALIGALGGIAPDMVSAPGRRFGIPGTRTLVGLHDWNHTRNERQGAANIATQALLTLAAAGFYLANDRQSR